MKPLMSVWTKAAKGPEAKAKLEQTIRASTTIVGRLKEILEEEERELDKVIVSANFESPAWACKQAFHLGEKARIKKLKDLLEIN